MNAQPSHLAMDGGQTGVRVRLVTPTGHTDHAFPGVLTDRPLPPQWAACVRAVLAEHPDAAPRVLAIGSSGLVDETAQEVLDLVGDLGVERVHLAHDSITSYLGALGDQPGCVIAAGTGTICLALGERSAARVDGWGHLIGDAGSAYWIGRTGMEAALRGHDGRRQMTALTDAMAAEFPDLEGAYVELQADPQRVARIASFAARVSELAATDRVASNILDKAAAHLSEAVQAGLRRVGMMTSETPRVAAIGGVFRSEQVTKRFTDYLSLQWPNFALTTPRATTLEGAAAVATLPDDHPFRAHVSVAERAASS